MKKITSIFCCLLLMTSLQAQSTTDTLEWKDLKYSMFIHWGIYSVLGGVWDGKPVSRGLSEQIQAHAGIYSDTYARVAREFNPGRWNADSIAMLAKSAGMRSVVITSKHHDGFCMFRSEHTDFNVVDATPFKRDVLKELADACQRHGLKLGIYFSLIDWHYPQASPISSHNSDHITPEHHRYNMNQVTELLTRYGPVSELWFDMGSQNEAQSRELRDLVHRLQPQCQVSSRIGNDMGDFTVMGDNQEPDYTIGVPWQSPASFFDETWGYRSWQKRGSEEEKVKEKLASLIRVVSRGGNYLLNIGPKDDGSVVPFEKNVLLSIGAWLKKNGEAIYATDPDPFQVSFDWGNITTRGNKMYLHVLSMPKENTVILPGLEGEIKDAYVLADRMTVQALRKGNTVTIHLPATFSVDNEYKVITLEFAKAFTVKPVRVIAEASGKITLSSRNAFKHYSSSGIDYNTRFRSTVKESWSLSPQGNGNYTPYLYYTEGDRGKTIDVVINGSELNVTLEGGELVKDANVSPVEWGPLYFSGPFWAGLEGSNGNTRDLDPGKPWPDTGERKSWIQQTGWRRGEVQSLPAEAMNAYYFFQEIVSPKDQSLIVRVTTGDGVVVFVNGEEQLTDNNPQKEKQQVNVLLIPLRKGRNQLLIKSFNNYQKQVVFSLEPHPTQFLYRKKLDAIPLRKDRISTASWRLHNPATPHQTILLQNLSLILERTKDQ